jgi:2,4-dienoyl-CoA reductase-like NADH-dependent reductase (Old Yellow Enzyme family)
MSQLFTPGRIGTLEIPNRIIRSATAERLAIDKDGRPTKGLKDLWVELAKGGTGLIITGHMFVHESGKCHPEMTGIHRDDLVPELGDVVEAVHQAGARIAVQINHGGMQCSKESVSGTVAPSDFNEEYLQQPARELTIDEIKRLIEAYVKAALRAKRAGFDAVQLHGAHGYLINQFLSPATNQRTDHWGGNLENRMRFLMEIMIAIRHEVGSDYPVFIKFGVEDGVEGGLTAEESKPIVSQFEKMGLNAIEVSGGFRAQSTRKGIKTQDREAYFRHIARTIRNVTVLPVILVGGLRSRTVMDDVLESGDADFISMCRPLINNPHFPNLLGSNILEKSGCISSNNCWPQNVGEGIRCKCPIAENE